MITAETRLAAHLPGLIGRASMRPQHDNCGNGQLVPPNLDTALASMRPQHDNCGNEGERGGLAQVRRASMRPQHDNCGNWNVTRSAGVGGVLQ